MSSGSMRTTPSRSAYERLAIRLAAAIVGDEQTARLVVRASAQTRDDPSDWVAFLADVRVESLRRRTEARTAEDRQQASPAPQHPGDIPTAALPIDAALLHEAFFSLADAERTILWSTLLGGAEGVDPERLAQAVAHLHEAVLRTSFPSGEDIP